MINFGKEGNNLTTGISSAECLRSGIAFLSSLKIGKHFRYLSNRLISSVFIAAPGCAQVYEWANAAVYDFSRLSGLWVCRFGHKLEIYTISTLRNRRCNNADVRISTHKETAVKD